MTPLYTRILPCCLAALATLTLVNAQTTIDFEDAGLALDTFITADGVDTVRTFTFGDLSATSTYSTSFGGFWSGGWAVSTSRDDSTGSFSNLVGSSTGGGANNSDTYLVGQQGARLEFPQGTTFGLLSFTNVTYTADVVENGSMFSRPFGVDTAGQTGVPDSLILQLLIDATDGSTTTQHLILADYRGENAEDYILREWAMSQPASAPSVDFVPATAITFNMLSSDNGMFGNNTPNFFAIDDVVIRVDPVSTRELANASDLQSWPMPARTEVYLQDETVDASTPVDLYILDATGCVLRLQHQYRFGGAVDVSGIAAGSYYISIVGQDYRAATQLVVK